MKTEKLIQALAEEAKPVITIFSPARQLIVWLVLTVLFFSGVIALFGTRPDFHQKLSEMHYLTEMVLAIITAVTAAMAAIWFSLPDMGQKPWVRWMPLLSLIIWVLYLMFSMDQTMPQAVKMLTAECHHARYDCAWHLALFALIPGALLFMMMRKAAAVHYYWAGGMAALAVASIGYLCLRILEENDSITHLLLWHVIPMFILSILGVFIGRVTLRW